MAAPSDAMPPVDFSGIGGHSGNPSRALLEEPKSPGGSFGPAGSGWVSSSSAAESARRRDVADDLKAELVSVILHQMQRLVQVVREEGAKQSSQIVAMHRAVSLRLEATLPQDGARPAEERRILVERRPEAYESEPSQTLSSDSLCEERKRPPDEALSDCGSDTSWRPALAAPPPAPSPQPRASPSQDSGRGLPFPQMPRPALGRLRAHVAATRRREGAISESYSELGEDEAVDRVTHGSSFSFQVGMGGLRSLDDQLTNSLFEMHGLVGGRRSVNRAMGSERAHSKGSAQSVRPRRGSVWGPRRSSVALTSEASEAATIGRAVSPSTMRLNFTRVAPGDAMAGQDAEPTETPYETESVGEDRSRASTLGSLWALAPRVLSRRLNGAGADSMDALRVEREAEVLASRVRSGGRTAYTKSEEEMQAEFSRVQEDAKWSVSNLILVISGIVPAETGVLSRAYRDTAFLTVVSALVGAAYLATELPSGSDLFCHMLLACTGLGALAGLASLRLQRVHEFLGPHERPLESYACAFGFHAKWHKMSSRCSALVLAMWAMSSACQAVMNLHFGCVQASKASILTCGMNILLTGVIYAVIFCKMHICCALQLAVDHFCMRFFEDQNPATGILEWNVMQALLRRAAHVVETCFLSVSAGVLAVVVLTSVEIYNMFSAMTSGDIPGLTALDGVCLGLWSGWVLPPVALMFLFVFRAAAITEQCNRVPALINSWSRTEHLIDHEKQYIVQYIMHSAAGFYVKGVRLNAAWALKLLYLAGVLLFSLLTQSVLKTE